MKLTKSDVRHTCFRLKNGQPVSKENEHIINLVKPLIPKNESFDTFSINWDLMIDKKQKIHVIIPETDFNYITQVCTEAKVLTLYGKKLKFKEPRKQNIIDIVELSMLGDLMNWENYNDIWGIEFDSELKRIHTKYFKTNINKVTEKMISDSANSDGAAMTSIPKIPDVVLEMTESTPISEEEFNSIINKE